MDNRKYPVGSEEEKMRRMILFSILVFLFVLGFNVGRLTKTKPPAQQVVAPATKEPCPERVVCPEYEPPVFDMDKLCGNFYGESILKIKMQVQEEADEIKQEAQKIKLMAQQDAEAIKIRIREIAGAWLEGYKEGVAAR